MPLLIAAALATALTLAGDAPQQAAIVPDELLGPYGLLVASLVVAGVLWRAYGAAQKAVVDELTRRAERAEALADVAVAGWREQTTASATAASAIDSIADQLDVKPKTAAKR